MIIPESITHRNRLLPEGKGIVVIYKNDFYIDYPIYEILNTKANEKIYGTITPKKNKVNGLEWRRELSKFNVDAKLFYNELITIRPLTEEEETEFWGRAGNVSKLWYLYTLTNFRMVV